MRVSMPMYILGGHILQLMKSLFPNTRDRTHAPCSAQHPNHWTTREVPMYVYFSMYVHTRAFVLRCLCVVYVLTDVCVCWRGRLQCFIFGDLGFEAACTRTDTCTDTSSNNKGKDSNSWRLPLLC